MDEKQIAHAEKIALERQIMDRAGVTRGVAREQIAASKMLREFFNKQNVKNDEPKPFKQETTEVKQGNHGSQLPLASGTQGGAGGQQAGSISISGSLQPVLLSINGAIVVRQFLYTP